MASTNQSPFYQRAEEDFLKATTDEERIACLEIMIKECPKHKSSENMLKNLTTRLKKLKNNSERKSKGKKGTKGIKKADIQCVLIGLPNSGKSTICNTLTQNNPESKVSPIPFSTYEPILATFIYENTKIQIIDDAPIPNHNKSLVNATDTLLCVITDVNQIKEIEEQTWKSKATKIYIFNHKNSLSAPQLHKLQSNMDSKHKTKKFIHFSNNINKKEIDDIKKEIFQTFNIIRIFTKEPGKETSKEPMLLKPNASIKDVAEKILKGMSKKITQARIWGPSSKFSGQKVGIEHIVKDLDTIEFKTK